MTLKRWTLLIECAIVIVAILILMMVFCNPKG
jgi:hypothetical protein